MRQEQQAKIWDHYQGGAAESFGESYPRLKFLSQQIQGKNQKILNIGVGNGEFERICVSEFGHEVSALDLSEGARSKLEALGVDFRLGSIVDRPIFEPGTFDYVFASEVLEHIPKEGLSQALSHIHSLLKPSGQFVGTVPYLERLADNEAHCPNCNETFHRWGHVSSFDEESFGALLKVDFREVSLKVRAFPDWRRKSLAGAVKSLARYGLGLLGSPMSSPHIFFKAAP